VEVVQTQGFLSDHYNPVNKKLALSPDVYGSNSIAAIGVACHEAGHAIQHATKYMPLWLRSALVPAASIGSWLSYIVIMLGLLLMRSPEMVYFGVFLFSAVVLFQLVTLPVEFDASSRAKRLAVSSGIILEQERVGMDKVLNAAAMTYVAAAVSSLMTLLYYVMLASGMRRD
jgi:Zn-dependent membrane protease YugP